MNIFSDEGTDSKGVKSLSLQTTENQIDREDKTILDEGGLYTFKVVFELYLGLYRISGEQGIRFLSSKFWTGGLQTFQAIM